MFFNYVLGAENCLDMCKRECIDGSYIYIYEFSKGKFHAVIYYPEANEYHDVAFKTWYQCRKGTGIMLPCKSIYFMKGGD